MSNWSNSSWCYCHLILGELKIEKSVIRFGGIKSGIKTPEIPLVNELGQCFGAKVSSSSSLKSSSAESKLPLNFSDVPT